MNSWRQLLLLTPSWLAMSWLVSNASWFWNHRPDLQFGWVVLLLCAYLFWEAWELRPAVARLSTWRGLWVGTAGLLFLLVLQAYQAAFGVNAASTMGLAMGVLTIVFSNLLSVYGWPGVRRFAFAFGFILIALPLPGAIQGPIVNGLQRKVAAVNVEVLNLVGVPAQQMGSVIQLPNCAVGVNEACSGIRSLQSAVMATLFIGYLSLRKNLLRGALLAIGMALAVAGNLARSLFLSLAANKKGTAGLEAAHDTAGWSILLFTVAGVAVCAWLLHKAEGKTRPSSAIATPDRGQQTTGDDSSGGPS